MYKKWKCYASIPNERSTSAVTNVEVTTSCISWNSWKSINVTKMTPNSADYITSMSTLSVNLEKINQCISPLNQLLTMLRYFATGSHIDSVADYMGMDSTTAGRIIHKVSRAVASLYRRFIKFPSTEEEKGVTKEDFFRAARFPNVVGALDCTHIKIKSPGGEDAEIYRNRKDFFSINVQAICDSDNNFLDVVARWLGSSHDSTIFNNSNIKARFDAGEMKNCILLGISFKKISVVNPLTPPEQLYNEAHIRTRMKIECTFGIVKRRFPVLAYGCRLKLKNVLPVVIATAVLHNIARANNEDEPGIDGEDVDENELNRLIDDGHIRVQPAHNEIMNNGNAYSYRRQLILNYFAGL
ncbi:putative nuclease HARBI1 isoform X2 [Tenebrio molitor]